MAAAPTAYRVIDRSILLPMYRRALIEPALRHIPARVSPNAITHVGHAVNLLGLAALLVARPHRGPLFAVAALTLQLHVWCDNVDGGHARRTGQCSPRGEFLDHGLDTFNVIYIALLTCLGLGLSPGWWVVLTLLVPGAASVTFWEQSHTGTFHLGLLNQVESAILLGAVLLAAGAWGDDFSARASLAGVSLRDALCWWTVVQISVGALRNVLRTVRDDRSPLASIAPLLAFDAAVGAAFVTGALTSPHAVLVGAAGNAFFALRMLVRRLGAERPLPEPLILLGAAGLGVTLTTGGGGAHSAGVAAVAGAAFGAAIARDFREGLRRSDVALLAARAPQG